MPYYSDQYTNFGCYTYNVLVTVSACLIQLSVVLSKLGILNQTHYSVHNMI